MQLISNRQHAQAGKPLLRTLPAFSFFWPLLFSSEVGVMTESVCVRRDFPAGRAATRGRGLNRAGGSCGTKKYEAGEYFFEIVE